jgi:hypothetical protein
MKQTEFEQIVDFVNLPVYEEEDTRVEQLRRAGESILELFEASTIEQARCFLSDPTLIPKAAVRLRHSKGTAQILVYFWRLR